MPYCENCGAQLDPNPKFCTVCGKPLNNPVTNVQPMSAPPQYYSPPSYSAPPPPPPPPMQPSMYQQPPQVQPAPSAPSYGSEAVIGVIMLKKPKSFGRADACTGVLTNQRFIFAQLTSEMFTAAAQQARDQAKAEGKGFFGQWGDQLKATFAYGQRYLRMQPDAIIAETPGNFALYNNTISEIGLSDKYYREDQAIYEFDVHIHSTAGRFDYVMDQNSDYVRLLKQVYGERVKTPLLYFNKGVNIRF